LEYLKQTEASIRLFLTPRGLNKRTRSIRIISPPLLQICNAP
jgi:hypothetical protein